MQTKFYRKLRTNLLDTIIKTLKFRFSGWWFDAAGVDPFLQYWSFCFKFGRHLESGVRNDFSTFRQVLKILTGAGIFIQRHILKCGLERRKSQSVKLYNILTNGFNTLLDIISRRNNEIKSKHQRSRSYRDAIILEN